MSIYQTLNVTLSLSNNILLWFSTIKTLHISTKSTVYHQINRQVNKKRSNCCGRYTVYILKITKVTRPYDLILISPPRP